MGGEKMWELGEHVLAEAGLIWFGSRELRLRQGGEVLGVGEAAGGELVVWERHPVGVEQTERKHFVVVSTSAWVRITDGAYLGTVWRRAHPAPVHVFLMPRPLSSFFPAPDVEAGDPWIGPKLG
jgi:hypothetical protein